MLSIFKRETHTTTIPKSNIPDLVHDGNNYFSDELICLDEKLTGNLFCAEKVIVAQDGELTGNITSKNCQVTGVVNGNITSLDLLDIKASAVVRGNIQSATVNIEPGAVINGYITVGEDIEALNAQWNKTKFSTDEYLTLKLKKELASLNKISTSVSNNDTGKIAPGLVAAISGQVSASLSEPLKAAEPKPLVAASSVQEKQETYTPTVAKPKPLAAAAPRPEPQEQENNSRWW
jgi:cytoskeletal protein CcmA (bactofilin family)